MSVSTSAFTSASTFASTSTSMSASASASTSTSPSSRFTFWSPSSSSSAGGGSGGGSSGSPETVNTATCASVVVVVKRAASPPPAPVTFPELCSCSSLRGRARRDGSYLGSPTNCAIRHHVRRRTSLRASARSSNNCDKPYTQTLPQVRSNINSGRTVSRWSQNRLQHYSSVNALISRTPHLGSSFASSNQAVAATLSSDSTMQSTTATRPLLLPNRDGGTKSSSIVFSNNTPMTSSSSSPPLSVKREGCMPPNLRTGELASTASFPGLLLPPLPRTDGSIVRHLRTRQRQCLYRHSRH
ncbi:hypothetical protein EDB86DRAFT_2875541 [Lactarius hatsudake]|nr:hypothetical protein EDB86DRAFT_2875541 [Lactarius hatsudake]